jgi:hypothetical protein
MPEPKRPFGGQDRPATGKPMASTGATDEEEIRASKVANRFDIRRLIGGVFLVYGLILCGLGLFGSHEIKNKAAGVNIDLWTGIGMLVFGALMVFWALSRPTMPEPPETRGEGSGRIRRAPG